MQSNSPFHEEQPYQQPPPRMASTTPTKQNSLNHYLQNTHYCSRELQFVRTPPKPYKTEFFSNLLSGQREALDYPIEFGSATPFSQAEKEHSMKQAEENEEEDVSHFSDMVIEEEPEEQRITITVTPPQNEETRQLQIIPTNRQARPERTCNCKNSQCVRGYCECFRAGDLCSPLCQCRNCGNTSRAAHKNRKIQHFGKISCNCKKSECHKKYCECFTAGQACSAQCNCLNCKNTVQMYELQARKNITQSSRKKPRRRTEDFQDQI